MSHVKESVFGNDKTLRLMVAYLAYPRCRDVNRGLHVGEQTS
jgi:hypothetical protein